MVELGFSLRNILRALKFARIPTSSDLIFYNRTGRLKQYLLTTDIWTLKPI